MKILFYIHHISTGGAERVTSILMNELVKKNHCVYLIQNHPVQYHYEIDNRINVINILKKNRKLPHLLQLRKKIKEIHPDVCIAVLPYPFQMLYFATLGLGIPIVVSDHTNVRYFVHRGEKAIRTKLYKFADAVTVLTKNDQKYMADNWNVKNTVVMYNPLSFPRLQYDMGTSNTVLCVGRLWALHGAKGFDRMIRMWGKISPSHPNWILIIAGSGEKCDFDFLQNIAKEENVEDKIMYTGFCNNIQDWMATSPIFALPSRDEGFPCVLTEAMSQRCACVAFEIHGNINEILTDGYDGYVVKDDDLDAFQEKLEFLMDNEEERKRIADNAYESVLRFSPEKIADQWEEMLTDVVNKKKKK